MIRLKISFTFGLLHLLTTLWGDVGVRATEDVSSIAKSSPMEYFKALSIDSDLSAGRMLIKRDAEASNSKGNTVEENDLSIGLYFGGSCTCPDGQVYLVGDRRDDCKTLACTGGSPGTCYRGGGQWFRRSVTCGPEDKVKITVLSIGYKKLPAGEFFNFDHRSTKSNCFYQLIENGVDLRIKITNLRNRVSGTARIWKGTQGGSIGTAQGRYDPYWKTQSTDWQKGDILQVEGDACKAGTIYYVTVYTAPHSLMNIWPPGTDGEVYIEIVGEYGTCAENRLSSARDDFEAGSITEYEIECDYLGEISNVTVYHEAYAPFELWSTLSGYDEWLLDKIEVVQGDSKYIFDCDCWITPAKPPLTAGEASEGPYASDYNYEAGPWDPFGKWDPTWANKQLTPSNHPGIKMTPESTIHEIGSKVILECENSSVMWTRDSWFRKATEFVQVPNDAKEISLIITEEMNGMEIQCRKDAGIHTWKPWTYGKQKRRVYLKSSVITLNVFIPTQFDERYSTIGNEPIKVEPGQDAKAVCAFSGSARADPAYFSWNRITASGFGNGTIPNQVGSDDIFSLYSPVSLVPLYSPRDNIDMRTEFKDGVTIFSLTIKGRPWWDISEEDVASYVCLLGDRDNNLYRTFTFEPVVWELTRQKIDAGVEVIGNVESWQFSPVGVSKPLPDWLQDMIDSEVLTIIKSFDNNASTFYAAPKDSKSQWAKYRVAFDERNIVLVRLQNVHEQKHDPEQMIGYVVYVCTNVTDTTCELCGQINTSVGISGWAEVKCSLRGTIVKVGATRSRLQIAEIQVFSGEKKSGQTSTKHNQ